MESRLLRRGKLYLARRKLTLVIAFNYTYFIYANKLTTKSIFSLLLFSSCCSFRCSLTHTRHTTMGCDRRNNMSVKFSFFSIRQISVHSSGTLINQSNRRAKNVAIIPKWKSDYDSTSSACLRDERRQREELFCSLRYAPFIEGFQLSTFPLSFNTKGLFFSGLRRERTFSLDGKKGDN